MELFLPVAAWFWSIIAYFLFCEFGEMVTSAFNSLDMFDCNWFLFPMDIQRLLPTIILNARQPVVFRGFANVLCKREAFRSVSYPQLSKSNIK